VPRTCVIAGENGDEGGELAGLRIHGQVSTLVLNFQRTDQLRPHLNAASKMMTEIAKEVNEVIPHFRQPPDRLFGPGVCPQSIKVQNSIFVQASIPLKARLLGFTIP